MKLFFASFAACTLILSKACNAFVDQRTPSYGKLSSRHATSGKGFGVTLEKQTEAKDWSNLSVAQSKEKLLDLLPRMTGKEEEFRTVEVLVNNLEANYQQAQTLDFLNLVLQGEWQLLFSTNLSGTPNPAKFRLRELYQRIECNKLEGKLINEATWDLAEQGDGNFECSGTFTVDCNYKINQGARMMLDLDEHILKPAKGTPIPKDVPSLVGLLHRAMPKELFDPADHAIDTTYLDGDLRIARHTGPRLEGVRDIFIRRGSLQINPVAADD